MMAGPGGGPPRRSHTKSRNGCKTCKSRHIRCDEKFPQCANCTKHSCRCDYMDVPLQGGESAKTPTKESSGSSSKKKSDSGSDVGAWKGLEGLPSPPADWAPPLPMDKLSSNERRLIHHVVQVSRTMQAHNVGKFTIWTEKMPTFLKIAGSYEFVLHAVLALSATHIAWARESQATRNVAYHHHGIAIKGLQEALSRFSKDNSDAVLAASILLSLQATEWRGWVSLMQGTSTVIEAMRPWRHVSHFADFMDEQATFPAPPGSPLPVSPHHSPEPNPQDLAMLEHVNASLQAVQSYLEGREGGARILSELITFIHNLRTALPVLAPAEQFKLLQPLRSWLLWLPVSLLPQDVRDPAELVVLAYFYAAALAVEPLFPAIGAAYFSSMSVTPIEEIIRRLNEMQSVHVNEDLRCLVELMNFPLEMVDAFRARMGWVQQEMEPYPPFQLHPPPEGLEHLSLGTGPRPLDQGPAYSGSHSPHSAAGGVSPLAPMEPSPHGYSSHLSPHVSPYETSHSLGMGSARDPAGYFGGHAEYQYQVPVEDYSGGDMPSGVPRSEAE